VSEFQGDSVTALQREVCLKLGQCILRLQQYERLSKLLVANSELTTTYPECKDTQVNKAEALANKTLGQVVGDLTGSLLAVGTPDSNDQDDDNDLSAGPSGIRITSRFYIAFSPDDHGLKVSWRNWLAFEMTWFTTSSRPLMSAVKTGASLPMHT
jgi:hypothetical protein